MYFGTNIHLVKVAVYNDNNHTLPEGQTFEYFTTENVRSEFSFYIEFSFFLFFFLIFFMYDRNAVQNLD